jgi:protein-disulfide isomerase
MRILSRTLATLAVLLVLTGSEAFPQADDPKIPWSVLPILQNLVDKQKSDLLELLKQEPNYSGCKETIFTCLLQERPDGTAVRLANFAAYLLSRGVPLKSLGEFFEKRKIFAEGAEIHTFNYETAPIYGNKKAAIRLTEFAEFKCPMCGSVSPLFKKLVDESNGTVQLCFKHFPILSHKGTIVASKSAVAAQRQGKFWEMAALLYRNMDRNEENQILDLASNLGLDMARFKKDLADPEVERIVRSDKVEAVKIKVNSTPTLFINGRRYELRMDEAYLQDIINEEAERIGIDPPYKKWVYR